MKTVACVLIAFMGMLIAPCHAQLHYSSAIPWMPEFSGCYSPEPGRFWTCSDERSLGGGTNRNEIWKIDFNTGACVTTNQFSLELNDMEAIASDGTGGFFVVTSQSLTSGLEWKTNRNNLTHFMSNGTVEATATNVRGRMVSAFSFLGSYTNIQPKYGGLDVEGMAYNRAQNRMWLGLRGPLVNASAPSNAGVYAVLLTMTNVLSSSNTFKASTFGWETNLFLNLGGVGIRDLFYDADSTNLFILAGKTEANSVYRDNVGSLITNTPACHVLAYDVATSNLTYCLKLPQVPDYWPDNPSRYSEAEGITVIVLSGQKKLLVTYDSKTNGIYQALDFPNPTKFAGPASREALSGM